MILVDSVHRAGPLSGANGAVLRSRLLPSVRLEIHRARIGQLRLDLQLQPIDLMRHDRGTRPYGTDSLSGVCMAEPQPGLRLSPTGQHPEVA